MPFLFLGSYNARRLHTNVEFMANLHRLAFLVLLVTNYEESVTFVAHLEGSPGQTMRVFFIDGLYCSS